MGIESLRQEVSRHSLLLLDTMIFSYHLGAEPRYHALTKALLDLVETGIVEALITTVTLAEVLTRPAQAGDRRAMWDYEAYLTSFPHLTLVSLDQALAREVALVRSSTRLRMPDAVQVAAARRHGADLIVSNDRLWRSRFDQPALLLLGDYVDQNESR